MSPGSNHGTLKGADPPTQRATCTTCELRCTLCCSGTAHASSQLELAGTTAAARGSVKVLEAVHRCLSHSACPSSARALPGAELRVVKTMGFCEGAFEFRRSLPSVPAPLFQVPSYLL